MIIEAYNKNRTKFKVGMEVEVATKEEKYYIFDIALNDEDKADGFLLINNTLSEPLKISANSNKIKLTGNFEPDILKLKKKLIR